MRLGDWSEIEAFRDEVRSFIAAEGPDIPTRAGFRSPEDEAENELRKEWRAKLYEAGYQGADWPVEWGGAGEWNPVHDLVVSEEVAKAGLPPLTDQTHLAAFALIEFGTEAQKARFLPKIRNGEETWCQLFSEPDAGSDLANMRTEAIEQEDGTFLVNGQKVWSSNAAWADFGFLLARSDLSKQRHQSISAFVVPMDAEGLEIRPIREITGTEDFSEVFLQDVTIGADSLLGQREKGWTVAMESLGAERSGIGAGGARLRELLGMLLELVSSGDESGRTIDRDDVRQRIGAIATEIEVNNLLVQLKLSREIRNSERPSDVPIGKLVFSELNLEMAEFALEVQGSGSILVEGDKEAVQDGRWQDEFLYARTYTVAGGASEIMRNIIAERALGMPREARG